MSELAPYERPCPFCSLPAERIVAENTSARLIFDGFPISPGHALIIPKRHVGSIFEVTDDERADLWSLLESAKTEIAVKHTPGGYNIGINDGPVAGQTVPHLHIHLIPRYPGDRTDPRGGVRWILPDRADYWTDRK